MRASEHCSVQLDRRIEAGADVEWQLSIYDLLDTIWPWKPQDEGAEEEGVHDERGTIFNGMFLGVTHTPQVLGPEYISTTLSGLRARDGSVLHRGRLLDGSKLQDGSFMESQEDNVGESLKGALSDWPRLPIKKRDQNPAVVTLRLDRRKQATKGYACRLWLQRSSGCAEEDPKAVLLVDDLGFDDDIDLYPAVYASRPREDILHAVKLRCFPLAFRQTEPRPIQRSRSLGMRDADPTVGFWVDDHVERVDTDSDRLQRTHTDMEVCKKFESHVPKGTPGVITGFAQDHVEVHFAKFGSWTVPPIMIMRADEVGDMIKSFTQGSLDAEETQCPVNAAHQAAEKQEAIKRVRSHIQKEQGGSPSKAQTTPRKKK